MIQNTRIVTKNTLFVNHMTQNTLRLLSKHLRAFITRVEKIITYALGEHDPGSSQDWRMSSDFKKPVPNNSILW